MDKKSESKEKELMFLEAIKEVSQEYDVDLNEKDIDKIKEISSIVFDIDEKSEEIKNSFTGSRARAEILDKLFNIKFEEAKEKFSSRVKDEAESIFGGLEEIMKDKDSEERLNNFLNEKSHEFFIMRNDEFRENVSSLMKSTIEDENLPDIYLSIFAVVQMENGNRTLDLIYIQEESEDEKIFESAIKLALLSTTSDLCIICKDPVDFCERFSNIVDFSANDLSKLADLTQDDEKDLISDFIFYVKEEGFSKKMEKIIEHKEEITRKFIRKQSTKKRIAYKLKEFLNKYTKGIVLYYKGNNFL